MKPILNINDLHLEVRQNHLANTVLSGVDLSINIGEIHGLVGDSGAGKSMLAKAILGILPTATKIRNGKIQFDGKDITRLDRKQRRHLASRHIAMIPQDPMTSLNPVRRVGKQVCDVLQLHIGMSRAEAQQETQRLLDDVQIREPETVMRKYPFELSGGMRQRVLIAIAFSCKPELIIADEPTTALDVTVQRQILQLIKHLQMNSATSLLFISHDLGVVAKICDCISIMQNGRIVECQSAERLFDEPQHAYTQSLLETTSKYYLFDSETPTESQVNA